MSSRKRSQMWKYFTDSTENLKQCCYCNKLISVTGGATGNLKRHLKKKHNFAYIAQLKQDEAENLFQADGNFPDADKNRPEAGGNLAEAEDNLYDGDVDEANEKNSEPSVQKSSLPVGKRSKIWSYFTQAEWNRMKCNRCSKVISVTGGSTGNLLRHLKRQHNLVVLGEQLGIARKPEGVKRLPEAEEILDNDADEDMEENFESTKHQSSPPRKRSKIWRHFIESSQDRVECVHCNKVISKVGGSTSNLLRHLKRNHNVSVSLKEDDVRDLTEAEGNPEDRDVDENMDEYFELSEDQLSIRSSSTMDQSEQFSLCWDNFHRNMSSGMNSLLENEDLVDVTLAVGGKYLKAHKMVLSVCSPYFKELFKVNPCKHPIVFLKDVSYVAMRDLLQFMYQGEVQVSQEHLTTFIKTAEALQIKGLTGDGSGSSECDTETIRDEPEHIEIKSAHHRQEPPVPKPKKIVQPPSQHSITLPAPKRQRVSAPHPDPIITTSTITAKTEPIAQTASATTTTTTTSGGSSSAAPTNEQLLQFKMEPFDQSNQSVTISDDNNDDTQFGDDPLDDTNLDDTNDDYGVMEGGDEEPQAGTSADGTAGEGQGRKKFQCKTCGRRYYKNFHLNSHIRYECGKDPSFFCDSCFRGFHQKSNLKAHQKKCTGKAKGKGKTLKSDDDFSIIILENTRS